VEQTPPAPAATTTPTRTDRTTMQTTMGARTTPAHRAPEHTPLQAAAPRNRVSSKFYSFNQS